GVWGPDPEHVSVLGEDGKVWLWTRTAPGILKLDPTFPSTVNVPLGPIHGAGGTTWIAAAQRSTVFRNSGSGWIEMPAFTTGDYGGGLWAISPTNVVLSSSGQSLVARYNGTSWVREESGYGSAAPRIFRPPGGPTFLGTYGLLLEHN